MEISRLRTRNHSAYRLYYHLVLSMKYRHKCLKGPMLERLEEMLRSLLIRWGGELVEFGGEADHCAFAVRGAANCKAIRSGQELEVRHCPSNAQRVRDRVGALLLETLLLESGLCPDQRRRSGQH